MSLILSLAGSDWASGDDWVYILSLGYSPVLAASSLRIVNVGIVLRLYSQVVLGNMKFLF